MGFVEFAQQAQQELDDLAKKIGDEIAKLPGTSQDVQALGSQWQSEQVPLLQAAGKWLVDNAASLDLTGGTAAEQQN